VQPVERECFWNASRKKPNCLGVRWRSTSEQHINLSHYRSHDLMAVVLVFLLLLACSLSLSLCRLLKRPSSDFYLLSTAATLYARLIEASSTLRMPVDDARVTFIIKYQCYLAHVFVFRLRTRCLQFCRRAAAQERRRQSSRRRARVASAVVGRSVPRALHRPGRLFDGRDDLQPHQSAVESRSACVRTRARELI
jgi:hypothetical protein